MPPKRQPDYQTATGSRFWFKELLYWSNTTGYKTIYSDGEGDLRMHAGKRGKFKVEVQNRFRDWVVKESESILVDGQTEEKTS